MPLTMRPTGLGSGIDKDRADYSVFCGEWNIGRIYEVRGGPDDLRWFWSFTLHGPMTRSDRAATLEEAKAQFQKSWDEWKARAKWRRRSDPALAARRRRHCVHGSGAMDHAANRGVGISVLARACDDCRASALGRAVIFPSLPSLMGEARWGVYS
jgi:hypothetical protein